MEHGGKAVRRGKERKGGGGNDARQMQKTSFQGNAE